MDEKQEDPEKKKELQYLIWEEQSRGVKRRSLDSEKLQEQEQLKNQMRILLKINNRKTFLEILTSFYELRPESEEYKHAVRIWDEYQRAQRTLK